MTIETEIKKARNEAKKRFDAHKGKKGWSHEVRGSYWQGRFHALDDLVKFINKSKKVLGS